MKSTTRILLFCGIVVGIIVLYILPFQKMGIDSHFFEILEYMRSGVSWHTLWTEESIQSYYPLYVSISESPYFSFYRPLLQSAHYLEFMLFGTWWLGYVFCSMLFFALSAGLLALIFSYFFSLSQVLILTALTIFHPALSPSFFSVTALFSMGYFFIALSCLFLIWYADKKKYALYMLSLLFYLAALLTYEFFIIVPLLLLLVVIFYQRLRWYNLLPYFCIAGGWLWIRFFVVDRAYPYHMFNFFSVTSLYTYGKQALISFWGAEYSSVFVALGLTVACIGWIWHCYMQKKEDRHFIGWATSSFLVAISSVFFNAPMAHFCLGLPFFAVLIYRLMLPVFSTVGTGMILLSLASLSAWRTVDNFVDREQYTNARDIALYEVLSRYPSEQYLFLIAPQVCKQETFLLSLGLVQGLRFVSQNPYLQVYHFSKISLCTTAFPSGGTIEVYPIDGGYRLQVTDEDRIWFAVPDGIDKIEGTLGTIFINRRISMHRAIDISIFLKPKYCQKDFLDKTIIFSWDPSMWKFVPVEKNHLIKL